MSCNMMWLLAQVFPGLHLTSFAFVGLGVSVGGEAAWPSQNRALYAASVWMNGVIETVRWHLRYLQYSLHVFNLPVGLMPTKLKSQQHSYIVLTMDSRSVLSHAYTRRATRSRLHDGLQKFVWRGVCIPYLARPVAQWLRRKGVSLVSDSSLPFICCCSAHKW